MINSSPFEYVFIRTCIFGLQAVLPLSIICTLHGLTQWPIALHLPLPIRVWCGLETLFFVAFMGPWLWYIQRDADHLPLHPEPARRRMFARSIAGKNAAELETTLARWFDEAEIDSIGRDAVKDWLAWAFFEGRVGDNTDEIEDYVCHLESILGRRFQLGKGTSKPLRLTLDPFATKYPSLLWYFCVGFVDFLSSCRLLQAGFTLYRAPLSQFFTLFPFRPIASATNNVSPTKHLTYWMRPHTSKTKAPILFIHGIGIGLYPYTKFLDELNTHLTSTDPDDQVGILAIEIMPISFRITHPIPDPEVMCHEIAAILSHHAWTRFVLVSHSYGSVIATHLFHDPHLRPKITATLFIDPVCFLLSDGDVAHNFTVRQPVHANEWQLWYFASLDPAIAHTLARRFFWSVNVLWREDLVPFINEGRGVSVSLASRDLIVNTEAVAKYLSQGAEGLDTNEEEGDHQEEKDLRCHPWRGKGLEVLWFDDLDHAQVFDAEKHRKRLIRVLEGYCTGGSESNGHMNGNGKMNGNGNGKVNGNGTVTGNGKVNGNGKIEQVD